MLLQRLPWHWDTVRELQVQGNQTVGHTGPLASCLSNVFMWMGWGSPLLN